MIGGLILLKLDRFFLRDYISIFAILLYNTHIFH
ncbi:hypothetical protein HD_1586 [[Haemophilus] ducreyi 35000HP]|uniref:Uncharacterized protein n=1 Tax=Haemophilus ducreyi (strain 35000HP / ATCC 700724) TaxID=233412 RepID=Q7VL93_HAEDU|nr:hypothetical protein HD_1586 [[Haemophilus] ducreyi 35000HP]